MSTEKRIMAGACLLCVGVLVGCVQVWLAVAGRAPAMSGLSLLSLGLGGLGAGLMIVAGDGGPAPAGVGAAPARHGPAGASGAGGAAASASTPDTDDVDDDAGAEEVLAAAARIVDGAVADEADAAVARIHGVPHSHLRMVLSPGGQVTTGAGATGDGDVEGDDVGVPGVVCELVAPSGWMGAGLISLAETLMSHRRMQELLGQLAADGDASAIAAAEYLRIDIPDGREQ
ncbi:hypothetical protein [Actinomyces procaprae]|uniref:hypothetical protein n=1 Tax=Actinomyces procaprae TaxID=2560010 RepID=UPI00109DF27C|nr:hypothetical protein [Actinomyces procaprae]